MQLLILGLLIFLSNHSIKMVAPQWRARFVENYGANTWKTLYSLFSLSGLLLIIYGYGLSRTEAVFLWNPPLWTRHIALVLTWLAFILLAAAAVKNNHIKQRLGHPMYAGIKIWAFAHLLANGRLSDVLLFAAFMVWAIAGFSISRRRDRRDGISRPDANIKGTLVTVAAGSMVWAVIVFGLHQWLIGVSPLPF